MTKLKSYILPIVVGVMLGTMLQVLGEKGIYSLYPLPDGIPMDDKQGLVSYMASLPNMAFILLLGNYFVCTIIAGLSATLIAGRTIMPAAIAGIIITLGGIYSAIMLSFQPVWYFAFSIVILLPAALIGYALGRIIRPEKANNTTLQ
jgi:hypothetical protein